MARKAKDKIIFETFGHIAIIKTATPDKRSILQIIITVDAKDTYDVKKKKGKKWIS